MSYVGITDLSEDARKRFAQICERAEEEYARDVNSARRSGIGPTGMDLYHFWERLKIVEKGTKQACLRYFGSLFFFFFDELDSQQLPTDELRDEVNRALVVLRNEILQRKWPDPLPGHPRSEALKEQDFDYALIEWLEARKEWREYEAKILPELAALAAPHDSAAEPSSPLMYFLNWPLEHLSVQARRTLRSGLLQIHGAHLERTNDLVECSLRTYDLIAGEFDRARLLSEDFLQSSILEMVADASAGGGWSAEPMGRTQPTAIYSVRFGSQFYPLWRLENFLELLQGRISHWSGRLVLNPSVADGAGSGRGRRPQSEEHKRVASKVASLGGDWKESTNLSRLAEWMDTEEIPFDKRSRKDGNRNWVEKCDLEPEKFIKDIQYRLNRAKK
jgi:hypothetical protein